MEDVEGETNADALGIIGADDMDATEDSVSDDNTSGIPCLYADLDFRLFLVEDRNCF